MATFRVYYVKSQHAGAFRFGDLDPVLDLLDATHVYLRDVEASDLEDVYRQSQGECWSPNGEARSLIEAKGLHHTSMSVGDVIEDADGEFWAVANFGFNPI